MVEGVVEGVEDTSITWIRVGDNDHVNSVRWSCITGKADDVLAGVAARGYSVASVQDFCEATVEESVKRGTTYDLYSLIGKDPSLTLQMIIEAAAQNQNQFVIPDGDNKGAQASLSCPLAFDAGYTYGSNNPDHTIAQDLSATQIETTRQSCFNTSSASTLDGLLAGTRLGQLFQQQEVAQQTNPSSVAIGSSVRAGVAQAR